MISGFQSRADGASPSTARGDIDATRKRMGDTLEELSTRLNPQRLKQQAKDKVREATIGRVQTMAQTTMDKATGAGRKVTDIVRENPIPAAMIAAGISWLFWNSRRGASSEPQSNYESQVSTNYSGSLESETSFNTSGETSKTEKAREKAGEVVDNVGNIAQRAKETTTTAATSVAEKARASVTSVAESARAKTDQLSSTFQSNPLPLGLIAASLGLAAGLAVPSTQKEGELVGEKRDELVDKAREIVSEKKEQAKRVAKRVVSEAKSTATQAAREEGLSGSA